MAWRDSRSQRLRLLVFSLAIVSGVAALTAIHSLKAGIERGVGVEAKSLLGSDLRISSRREIIETDLKMLAGEATELGQEVTFPSMMQFPKDGGARLYEESRGDFRFTVKSPPALAVPGTNWPAKAGSCWNPPSSTSFASKWATR